MRRPRSAAVRVAIRIGVCAVAIATLACHSARPVPPGRSAVLPAEQLEDVFRQCSRSAPTVREVEGTWEVSEEIVAKLEAGLPKLRRMRAKECCFLRRGVGDPGAYYR